MNITISPSRLSGNIIAPPSKSYMHRALICASLADAPVQIECTALSNDTKATLSCLRELGAEISVCEDYISVKPVEENSGNREYLLDCGESGSTLRFMLPVAASLGKSTLFTGAQRLGERPIKPLCEALKKGGIHIENKGIASLPCKISGKMEASEYEIDGGVSSQFVSGLMLALGRNGGGEIKIKGEIKSAPYISITQEVMQKFGVATEKNENGYKVAAGGYKGGGKIKIEGDYSNAAFYLVAGAINGDIFCKGLSLNTSQGDRQIVEILRSMGADIEEKEEGIKIKESTLKEVSVDCENIPDLVPVMCVAACKVKGKSVFYNIRRLREKESDRVKTTCDMITSLGGRIEFDENSITVYGSGALRGGIVDGANDHRIVMSTAVASLLCSEDVTIKGSGAVNKSYPDFFEKFILLGGRLR